MNSKITVLGSGTVLSSFYNQFDFRNTSSYLIQIGEKNILLDCGEGVRGNLDRIKFDYYKLDAVFISHFHPDHFTVEPLISSLMVRAMREKQPKKLSIYGPRDIKKIIIETVNNKHYPNFFETKASTYINISFNEYANEDAILYDNMTEATPYKVIHGVMDTYALRFQINDKIFAYSGDSSVCDSLIKAAKDADLFLCEAAIDIDDELADTKAHVSAYLAGEIAKKANAKHLVLTHYSGKDSPSVMKKEIKHSGFLGNIDIASDFDTFPL